MKISNDQTKKQHINLFLSFNMLFFNAGDNIQLYYLTLVYLMMESLAKSMVLILDGTQK